MKWGQDKWLAHATQFCRTKFISDQLIFVSWICLAEIWINRSRSSDVNGINDMWSGWMCHGRNRFHFDSTKTESVYDRQNKSDRKPNFSIAICTFLEVQLFCVDNRIQQRWLIDRLCKPFSPAIWFKRPQIHRPNRLLLYRYSLLVSNQAVQIIEIGVSNSSTRKKI